MARLGPTVWTYEFNAAHFSTGGAGKALFTCARPIKVTALSFLGVNPSETDADTTAVDLSYSTDGFSSSDVEIAAMAATEFNDTDNDVGTLLTAVDIPLTTASLDADGVSVRVPAGATIVLTTTSTGGPADISFGIVMEYKVL